MSLLENPQERTLQALGRDVAETHVAPALYATTLFVSALLLFSIQPMFAKMVLPKLGGAPAVWSVAMVFFQTVLLAGYGYAHLLGRALPPRRATLVHLALIAVTSLTLPIAIASGWGAPPATGTAFWLFGLFAASIGLPFFTLSASAPLLQSWFAASGHRQAGNPYVLYAASNLGSFAALLAYPVLLEPLLTLKMQIAAWSVGFALLALLMAAVTLLAGRGAPVAASVVYPADVGRVTTADRVRWTVLAAIPSGLVIAVTAHLTTDVAAAPFLWVIPLALYLLTFVAVFRERPWIAHSTVVRLLPFAVIPLAVNLIGNSIAFWAVAIVLNLIAFTLLTLLCHGELYARRPHPQRLTEFFLCTSFGGVVGGAFAGLFAPHLFSGNTEYPILILLALLAIPGAFAGGLRKALVEALPWLFASAALGMIWYFVSSQRPAALDLPIQLGLNLLAVVMLFQRHRPMRFFGLAVLGFVLTAFWRPGSVPVETARSFFGVHKVVDIYDGKFRLLSHGSTIHGAQRLRTEDGTPVQGEPVPQMYYYPGGAYAEAIEAARAAHGGFDRVAVVGLGTGTLACHQKQKERWTFFEIDPEVIRIARDPARFEFMSRCAPDAEIVLGDARLTLAASPDRYDLIVLDAFSSDAIPAHLLTREAFSAYLSKLTPRGVIVVHITNRHLDLAPELANIAQSQGLEAYLKQDANVDDFAATLKVKVRLVVLARQPTDLGRISESWTHLEPDPSSALWTDDYSNILGAMLRKKFGS